MSHSGGAGADSGQSGWLRRLLTGRKQSTDRIRVDPRVDESLVAEAAALTAGFSGRELAKMMASMQVRVETVKMNLSTDGILNCPGGNGGAVGDFKPQY